MHTSVVPRKRKTGNPLLAGQGREDHCFYLCFRTTVTRRLKGIITPTSQAHPALTHACLFPSLSHPILSPLAQRLNHGFGI